MSFPCPCCGQPIPTPPTAEDLVHAPVTPLARRIIATLAAEYPLEFSWRQIAAKVYGDTPPSDGGDGSIRVCISRTNRVLANYGWRIGASDHRGSGSVALRPIA